MIKNFNEQHWIAIKFKNVRFIVNINQDIKKLSK